MVELFIHNVKQIKTKRDVLDFDDREVQTYKFYFIGQDGQELEVCCFSEKIIMIEVKKDE